MGCVRIKIHKSSRFVVAVCDKEIFGKKLKDGSFQLNLASSFFDGDEFDEEEAIKILRSYFLDDASFNIVGEKSIDIAKKAGIISGGESIFCGVPVCLVLL
ncbi:DUF424 family protein [Candidatus Pacearchaeota archaeon]|nr:MAG: DUF424 family protein [Candidatus Pacearchaeota archaeon]